MVKHIVLFKLKDASPAGRKTAIDMLMSMEGKMDILKSIEAGTDILGSPRSYDVALICTFESKAALDAYQEHPVHLPVKKYMAEARESSVSCDFEYDA